MPTHVGRHVREKSIGGSSYQLDSQELHMQLMASALAPELCALLESTNLVSAGEVKS